MGNDGRVDAPGEVVAGKYRVEGLLGEGGMGYVLAARHLQFDDRVAIKLLHAEAARVPGVVERFLREGRAARQIRGEHVVGVSDLGVTEDGRPFMVMEYLEGWDLAKMLAARGPLPVDEVIDYVLQASEALVEAHVTGIIHRDLKPANLFLTVRRDGSACIKVVDFGISKMATAGQSLSSAGTTRPTGMMGTVLYASPEQLQSARDVDPRTDLWAMGVVMFELLTGKLPFEADDLPKMCVQVMMAPPRRLRALRPDVPEGLEQVIFTCLHKDREHRYASVADLANALTPFASTRSFGSIERVVGVARAHQVPVHPELARTSATFRASAFGISSPEAATPPLAQSTPMTTTLGTTMSVDDEAVPRRSPWPKVAVVALLLSVLGVSGVVASRLLGPQAEASGAGAAGSQTSSPKSVAPSAKLEEATPSTAGAATASSPIASASSAPSASSPPTLKAAAKPLVFPKPTATTKPSPSPKPTGKPDPFQE